MNNTNSRTPSSNSKLAGVGNNIIVGVNDRTSQKQESSIHTDKYNSLASRNKTISATGNNNNITNNSRASRNNSNPSNVASNNVQ